MASNLGGPISMRQGGWCKTLILGVVMVDNSGDINIASFCLNIKLHTLTASEQKNAH